jgi:hypothetical protein
MVGALAVACFVKAAGSAFLGEPRSEHAIHAHEAPPTMIGPMVALVACIFAIGLFPNAFAPVLDRAVASWLPKEVEPLSVAAVAPLTWIMRSSLLLVFSMAVVGAWLAWRLKVSSVGWTGTWDCGYAAPTARMEYTASSFAEMLVNLFGWALQPKVRVIEPQSLFPRSASYESSVPEVVLEMAVLPAAEHLAGWLVWFRWLQSGRIQAYLLYILVVLVLLLFWQ